MSYAADSRAPGNHPPPQPTESTGPIASDSLAAESLRDGGDFASNAPHDPQPLSVPGAKSTLATTDTSGAVPLPPASSGAQREIQDERGLGLDERGTTGVKYPDEGQAPFSGTTTSEGGYYGGPSSARQTQGYTTGAGDSSLSENVSSSSNDAPVRLSATGGLPSTSRTSGSSTVPTPSHASHGRGSDVPDAPTYTSRTAGTITGVGDLQPKGQNLTEGDIPETKTFLGDVGGPHDPGRLAERGFEKVNAQVAGGGVGSQGRDYGEDDKGGYEVLGGSERI